MRWDFDAVSYTAAEAAARALASLRLCASTPTSGDIWRHADLEISKESRRIQCGVEFGRRGRGPKFSWCASYALLRPARKRCFPLIACDAERFTASLMNELRVLTKCFPTTRRRLRCSTRAARRSHRRVGCSARLSARGPCAGPPVALIAGAARVGSPPIRTPRACPLRRACAVIARSCWQRRQRVVERPKVAGRVPLPGRVYAQYRRVHLVVGRACVYMCGGMNSECNMKYAKPTGTSLSSFMTHGTTHQVVL